MSKRFRNVSGRKIKAARIELGWSQDVLAAKLQLLGLSYIDRVSVAKIEGSIRSIYDYELAIIASVLSIELSQLVPSFREVRKNIPKLLGEE